MTAKMEINPPNIEGFKSIFNNLGDVVDTVVFECYNDRVEFNALDRSSTVFLSCIFGMDYFLSYECPESDRFSIDSTEMKKVLKSCRDELTLTFDDSSLMIESTTKKFQLVLIDENYDPIRPPQVEHFVKFDVPVKYLKSMVKDIELFAKDVTINTLGNQVSFNTEGHSGKFMDIYEVNDDFSPKKVKVSTDKLKTCLGSDKVSDDMILEIDTDMPLILRQEGEGISLTYMIAPRVDVSE